MACVWSRREALYRRKVEACSTAAGPALVLLIDGREDGRARPSARTAGSPGGRGRRVTGSSPTDPEDPALLHFTSGTTGTPKGAVHVHEAVVAHHVTGKLALDLHPDDVFWCTADPGWVTGTSYGIIAPLDARRHAASSTRPSSTPSAGTGSCSDERVTVWYTAPTAIRMLMQAGAELARTYDLCRAAVRRQRRRAAQPRGGACGGSEALGLPIHDNWWQTETGGIMIANFAGHGHPPGLDGPAAARHRGGDRAPRRQDGASSTTVGDEPDVRGRARAAAGLAVDVPRLPATRTSATASASPAAGT